MGVYFQEEFSLSFEKILVLTLLSSLFHNNLYISHFISHPSLSFLWLCAFVGGRYPRVEDCFNFENGGNVDVQLVGYRPSSPLLELGLFCPELLWKKDARGKMSVYLSRACLQIEPMPRGFDTPGASCH